MRVTTPGQRAELLLRESHRQPSAQHVQGPVAPVLTQSSAQYGQGGADTAELEWDDAGDSPENGALPCSGIEESGSLGDGGGLNSAPESGDTPFKGGLPAARASPGPEVGGAGGGGGAGEGGRETLEEWGAAVVRRLTEMRAAGRDLVNLNHLHLRLSEMGGREGIPARKKVMRSLVQLGFKTQNHQGLVSVSTDDRGGYALQEYMRRSSS